LSPDRVFFAPPPPEIGQILSAFSTLRQRDARDSRRRDRRFRAFLFVTVFVWSIFLSFQILPAYMAVPLALLMASLTCTDNFTSIVRSPWTVRSTCRYVGAEGIAEFKLAGAFSGRVGKDRVSVKRLLFAEADQYQVGSTGTAQSDRDKDHRFRAAGSGDMSPGVRGGTGIAYPPGRSASRHLAENPGSEKITSGSGCGRKIVCFRVAGQGRHAQYPAGRKAIREEKGPE